MKRFWLALVIVSMSARAANAQDVKCEKYKLSNGMTVILHEDHSLPVACINTWYYVGSKDESPGRSGFAHLFEHLMFMGTKRVPGNKFDVLMETGGGWNNASTSADRTNYFSFGPSSLLPTLLWLDADRLEDLGKEMNQEKLDKQREVVRNERRQTSEMRPYGKADLKITELMYPPGHPYHIEVIGTHEDLQAASVRDVKDFFASYYVPNNASLVVAGDFDPKEVKPLIEKLFGSLQRGPEPMHRQTDPVKIHDVRRVTFTDQVQFPRVTIAYHSPAHYAAGDAEMDVAGAVLSSGMSSRLYQRLIYEDKIATDVSAEQESQLLGSLFKVEVTARQGANLDAVEKAVDDVLKEFCAKGPNEDELERCKAKIEYGKTSELESVLAKADRFNEYNFFFNEPNSFKRDFDRYRQVTGAAVRDWSVKVLTPDARLIMRVLPEPLSGAPSPRDVEPGPLVGKNFAPPMPESFTLSNGVPVKHWRRSDLPLVATAMLLDCGASNDPAAQGGCADLTAEMLDEGAGSLGAVEFSKALDQIGAVFRAAADQESTTVRLSVLRRNLEKGLALFADAVLRPRFEDKEWDRVKRIHIEELVQEEDRPTIVATKVGLRSFFGEAHPYGRPTAGTPESVKALPLAAVKDFHARHFVPTNATLMIAGDLSADEAKSLLEKSFGAWSGPRGLPPDQSAKPEMPEPANQSMRVVIVDKPKAVQTVIRFYMPGPKYISPERVGLELLNTTLGGSFTSRLNQNLREKHGYTYGARSRFAMEPSAGYFTAGADVQAEVTGAALKEFLGELNRIRGGDLSPGEAAKACKTNRMDSIQSFQGLSGLLAAAIVLEKNGLPFTTLGQDLATMDKVTVEELNKLAKPSIPIEKCVLVLVGDKSVIQEQLKGLDLPTPLELTVKGEATAKKGA